MFPAGADPADGRDSGLIQHLSQRGARPLRFPINIMSQQMKNPNHSGSEATGPRIKRKDGRVPMTHAMWPTGQGPREGPQQVGWRSEEPVRKGVTAFAAQWNHSSNLALVSVSL